MGDRWRIRSGRLGLPGRDQHGQHRDAHHSFPHIQPFDKMQHNRKREQANSELPGNTLPSSQTKGQQHQSGASQRREEMGRMAHLDAEKFLNPQHQGGQTWRDRRQQIDHPDAGIKCSNCPETHGAGIQLLHCYASEIDNMSKAIHLSAWPAITRI